MTPTPRPRPARPAEPHGSLMQNALVPSPCAVRACLASLGLAAACLAASPDAAAQPGDPRPAAGVGSTPSDQADTLFRKGNELYKLEKWTEAEAAYRAAWDLKKTHDIASNLGHTAVKLGKYRDAAELYDFALRHHPPTVTGAEKKREFVQRGLADAAKHVGTVRVKVDPAGAEVSIDGKPIGTSPLEADVFVEPGRHALIAKLAGHADAQQAIEATPGSVQETRIVLGAGGAIPASAPPAPAAKGAAKPPAAGDEAPSIGILVAGSVLAVGGLVAGGVFTGMANGKSGDLDRLHGELGGGTSACQGTGAVGPRCTELSEARDAGKTYSSVAVTTFVIGGAFAAATLTYALWPRSRGANPSGVIAAPWVGAGSGGLVLGGAL